MSEDFHHNFILIIIKNKKIYLNVYHTHTHTHTHTKPSFRWVLKNSKRGLQKRDIEKTYYPLIQILL